MKQKTDTRKFYLLNNQNKAATVLDMFPSLFAF